MELTDLIIQWQNEENNPEIEHQLYLFAYDQLKTIARSEKKRGTDKYGGNTLHEFINNTTSLVNEAYLKLDKAKSGDIKNKKQFYSLVGTFIRQVLADQARFNNAKKRQIESTEHESQDIYDMLDLHNMLNVFSEKYPEQANILHLKYFMGLCVKEISQLYECSESKVEKELQFAKVWLKGKSS